jgi:hypothetical protein
VIVATKAGYEPLDLIQKLCPKYQFATLVQCRYRNFHISGSEVSIFFLEAKLSEIFMEQRSSGRYA